MLTGLVNPTDFTTSINIGNRLSKAFKKDDFIFGSSPKDDQFVVASLSNSKILERIDGNKGIVGPFAYKKNAIYTPIYHKPKRISKIATDDILKEYSEEMFGVTSMHFYAGFLFVVSKNGFYIFDEEKLSLISSFKNTNKSTVSHLNYYFNKESNLLYIADIREETGSFFVICADAKNNFKEVWRTKMNGELSTSGDFTSNGIYESEKYIVCPVSNEGENGIKIIDKTTGGIVKEFPTQANYSIVYQEEKMFAKGFRKDEIVCIELQSLNEIWSCSYNRCKGDLVLFENKLLLGCSDKGTLSIDTNSGESESIHKKMNVRPVYQEDLQRSKQYFIIDSYLCW